MPRFGVIIAAAGASSRFGGDEKKQFEDLAGRAVFVRAAEPFLAREDVAAVVVTVAADDMERIKTRWGSHLGFHGVKLTAGGPQRIDSVVAGFEQLPDDCDFVAIHDGARPLIDPDTIDKAFREAVACGAAIVAVPLTSTLKRVHENPPNDWGQIAREVAGTVPRQDLWLAQTPQVFRRDLYAAALAARGAIEGPITDDAQLVEATGQHVAVVLGTPDNFKITTAGDLTIARQVLKARGVSGPAEPPRRHRF